MEGWTPYVCHCGFKTFSGNSLGRWGLLGIAGEALRPPRHSAHSTAAPPLEAAIGRPAKRTMNEKEPRRRADGGGPEELKRAVQAVDMSWWRMAPEPTHRSRSRPSHWHYSIDRFLLFWWKYSQPFASQSWWWKYVKLLATRFRETISGNCALSLEWIGLHIYHFSFENSELRFLPCPPTEGHKTEQATNLETSN